MSDSAPIRTRRRIDLRGAEATIVVRRANYGMGAEEELETVQVPRFETEPARVKVEGGLTRHMGDNNYVKINVMLELPCLPEASEIDRAYGLASEFVSTKLASELEAAVTETDGGNGQQDAQPDEGEAQAEAAGIRRRIDV